MKTFEYVAHPSRVIFGAGYLDRVADEVRAFGAQRVFLAHDPTSAGFAGKVAGELAAFADVRAWDQVAQHVPIDLATPAREAVDAHRSDLVLSIGGGSTTGLAKAIALSHALPIVAVPTTYAGSEMTTIYGLTGDRHKQTGKSPLVLPKTVVYDPLLTLGLPANVTGPSAFNSLAHCVEGCTCRATTRWRAGLPLRACGRSAMGCHGLCARRPTSMPGATCCTARCWVGCPSARLVRGSITACVTSSGASSILCTQTLTR